MNKLASILLKAGLIFAGVVLFLSFFLPLIGPVLLVVFLYFTVTGIFEYLKSPESVEVDERNLP